MAKKKVNVVIDDREPEELLPYVEEHDDVDGWYIDRLEIGDILIEEADMLVERKSTSDYAGSLTSGHLTDQIRRMRTVSDNCFILLEGNLPEAEYLSHSRLSGSSIRGHMASTMVRHNTPIIPCGNMKLLVDMAVRLGRKSIEEPGSAYLDTGNIDKSAPVAKRMYACIEGVGPEMASKLHDEYPTVIDLCNVTEKDLQSIDGVGEKMSEQIVESLNTNGE